MLSSLSPASRPSGLSLPTGSLQGRCSWARVLVRAATTGAGQSSSYTSKAGSSQTRARTACWRSNPSGLVHGFASSASSRSTDSVITSPVGRLRRRSCGSWSRVTSDDRHVIPMGGEDDRGPEFRCSEIGERKSDEDDVTGLGDRRHKGLARSAILGTRTPPAASTLGPHAVPRRLPGPFKAGRAEAHRAARRASPA